MNKLIRVSYETMGMSSYVSVTCPSEMELVYYQLETLLSNKIKNLLDVSKQLIDGETVIYYNITSQIPLSQVLEKRKLKRSELLNLIEGVILAVQDASAYRLPAEGIMLEPEYIYVNPASCKPSFLYLPLEQAGEWGLKDLVSHLIMHDQIELSNDNLIQVLLKELNRQPFSLESLEKSLRQYQGNTGKEPGSHSPVPGTTGSSYGSNPVNRGIDRKPDGMPLSKTYPGEVRKEPEERREEPIERQRSEERQPSEKRQPLEKKQPPEKRQRPEGKLTGKKSKEKKPEKKTETNDSEEDAFDAEKAKKMFMLPQAAVMLIVAASVSFGLFVDETGKIVINNILVLVILLVLAEVILYREIFINRKKAKTPNEKKNGRQKKADTPDKKKKPAPPKPSRMGKPGKVQPTEQEQEIFAEEYADQEEYVHQENNEQWQRNIHRQSDEQQQNYIQKQNYAAQRMDEQELMQETLLDDADTDIGNETELWEDMEEESQGAYLEYYEDNRLTKIPVSCSGSTIIGRLESQVDFAVRNPKVGKVHAKFYGQNNQYFVVDINSKNGTYINGSRTRIESNSPYLLHDQDRITLADTELIIRCPRD